MARQPNPIKIKKQGRLYQKLFETKEQFAQRERENLHVLSPYHFTLAEARRLHNWFGRLVAFLEARGRRI